MDKFEEGIGYFQEGKFAEALEVFNRLLAVDPGNIQSILYRGRILSRLGSVKEALEDFDQLVHLEPNNANFISDRAVVLHLSQRNKEALVELDRALDLDPDNPYRYSSRAFLKDRMGDHVGAIADYEKALEMDPEDAVAYNNKGIVEEKLGYKERATASFKKADDLVRYVPENPQQPSTDVSGESTPTPEPDNTPSARKVSLSSYFSTFGKVLKDQDTRDEFFKFVTDKLKGKAKQS